MQCVGRDGCAAGPGHVGCDGLVDFQIHVGRGERQLAVLGAQQDIGENRDRIAALHDAMHVGEGS